MEKLRLNGRLARFYRLRFNMLGDPFFECVEALSEFFGEIKIHNIVFYRCVFLICLMLVLLNKFIR